MEALVTTDNMSHSLQVAIKTEKQLICNIDKLSDWAVGFIKLCYMMRGLSYNTEDDVTRVAGMFCQLLKSNFPCLTTEDVQGMVQKDNFGEGNSNTISPAGLIASLKRQGAESVNLQRARNSQALPAMLQLEQPKVVRTESEQLQVLKNDYQIWLKSRSIYNFYDENYKLITGKFGYKLSDDMEKILRYTAKEDVRKLKTRMATNSEWLKSHAEIQYHNLVINEFFKEVKKGIIKL